MKDRKDVLDIAGVILRGEGHTYTEGEAQASSGHRGGLEEDPAALSAKLKSSLVDELRDAYRLRPGETQAKPNKALLSAEARMKLRDISLAAIALESTLAEYDLSNLEDIDNDLVIDTVATVIATVLRWRKK